MKINDNNIHVEGLGLMNSSMYTSSKCLECDGQIAICKNISILDHKSKAMGEFKGTVPMYKCNKCSLTVLLAEGIEKCIHSLRTHDRTESFKLPNGYVAAVFGSEATIEVKDDNKRD